MKSILSLLIAGALMIVSASAADNARPLAPGKPAGIHQAQASSTTLLWLVSAGLVIGGIALLASGDGNQPPSGSSTTSSTTTTTP